MLSDRLLCRLAPRNESVHLVVRERAVDETPQVYACRREQSRLLRLFPELLDDLYGAPVVRMPQWSLPRAVQSDCPYFLLKGEQA